VHGLVLDQHGEVIGHAWVERYDDGSVYDSVLDRLMSARDYCHEHRAVVIKRFSAREAAVAALKAGHYGPW
jgi:hypothetical protein